MKKLILLFSFLTVACASTPPQIESSRRPSGEEAITCLSDTRQTISPAFQPKNKTKIKVAFFDADSTLRVSKSGSVSANAPDDVRILPHMGAELKKLAAANYLIYIVSNQGGVQAGKVTCETADKALLYTIQSIENDGGVIHGYDFSEKDDETRKPGIGMATRLERILKTRFGSAATIDKKHSLMVGDSAFKKGTDYKKNDEHGNWVVANKDDVGAVPGTHFSNSDRLFAANYGIKFIEASVFFGWRKYGVDVFENTSQVEEYLKGH